MMYNNYPYSEACRYFPAPQPNEINPNYIPEQCDANNNVFHPTPQNSPPPIHDNNGILGLPYHCYNYQDFPGYFDAAHSNEVSKTWRKRTTTRKRKLPEKVLRERQLRRNERERARQNRLNDAFDVLRNTIPEFLTPCKKGQKLTQIETLRLAKHYIGGLRDLLDGGHEVPSFIKQE